jgi:hypothetical protein
LENFFLNLQNSRSNSINLGQIIFGYREFMVDQIKGQASTNGGYSQKCKKLNYFIKKSSQEPLGQKSADLHKSFLT